MARGRTRNDDEGPIMNDRKFKVIINADRSHEGNTDVLLGNNGVIYQVQRDKEIVLPERFLNVLKDSKYTIYTRNDDGTEDVREVPRYSFNVLGEVTEQQPLSGIE